MFRARERKFLVPPCLRKGPNCEPCSLFKIRNFGQEHRLIGNYEGKIQFLDDH